MMNRTAVRRTKRCLKKHKNILTFKREEEGFLAPFPPFIRRPRVDVRAREGSRRTTRTDPPSISAFYLRPAN